MNPLKVIHEPMFAAAVEATTRAAAVCRYVQRTIGTGTRITKADRSPVTIADFAAQAVVCHVLMEKLGRLKMVAEESSAYLRHKDHHAELLGTLEALHESGAWPDAPADEVLGAIDAGCPSGHEKASEGDSFFTLDPIDGTKGFLQGQHYAVCLAHIERGQPTLGALSCPNLSMDVSRPIDDPDPHGMLMIATAHSPLLVAPADAPELLAVQAGLGPRDGPEPRLTQGVEPAHSDHSRIGRLLTALEPTHPPVRLHSQCKYAVVARGQADGYVRFPPRMGGVSNIWDHAPGILLCRRAGCVTTDVDGRELDFSRPLMSHNRGFLAAPPALHARIREIICRLEL